MRRTESWCHGSVAALAPGRGWREPVLVEFHFFLFLAVSLLPFFLFE